MEIKKIKRGEPLKASLLDLAVDGSVEIPYRLYSENSIRATTSQLKHDKGVAFEVKSSGNTSAIVRRLT